VKEHAEVDEVIKAHLKNWSFQQLNAVDKNILRLAIAEFHYSGEDRSDRNVIIDEAVEMAKTYGGESSYRFINGLLDQALKG
jgi:transcription antitermination protein NusB